MENHGGVKPHSCSHPYNFLTLLTEIGEEEWERRQWGAFMSPQLRVILRKKLTISALNSHFTQGIGCRSEQQAAKVHRVH